MTWPSDTQCELVRILDECSTYTLPISYFFIDVAILFSCVCSILDNHLRYAYMYVNEVETSLTVLMYNEVRFVLPNFKIEPKSP